jgi:hypothetical protein
MLTAPAGATLGTALLALTLASCSPDTPTQPAAPAPNASLVDGLVGTVGGTLGGVVGSVAPGLLSCPTTKSYSSTQVVGPAGGVIRVGPHALTIPAGALASKVRITATAPAGDNVLVEFAPHGLRFAKPTSLALSYRECGLVQGLLLQVVYVDDHRSILELVTSSNNIFTRTVVGRVDHFSGYAVATRK